MSMTSSGNSASGYGRGEIVEVEDTGVAWPAIIGGTVAASAFLLLLAPLGAGLGVDWNSPWQNMDSAQKSFTVASAIWLIVMQWISSGVGGYLTGRLRTAWAGAHTHEVYFRDTVHGFLTWALTTVIGFGILTAGFTHLAEHHPGPGQGPESYAVSRLLRSDQAPSTATEQDRMDSGMVLMQANKADGSLSDNDKAYLTRLVEARTGLSMPDAEKRVDDVTTQLKDNAVAMHKTMVAAAIFAFFSMWIGAFISSAAGALGGLHRDSHYATGKLNP